MAIAVKGWDGNTFGDDSTEKSQAGFVKQHLRLAFSGNYSTGGDTLDLTNGGVASSVPVESGGLVKVSIDSNGPSGSLGAGGGYYQYVPGTTLANGKLKAFSAGGTEYSAGAYGTDVTTDVVLVTVEYKR